MTPDLQKTLYDKYPDIFKDKDKSMQETCMCWGIDTNDGWYTLIDNLCQEIISIEKTHGVSLIADQVKEKYGGLRFYYHLIGNDKATYEGYTLIEEVVTKYESMSEVTCEVCGEPGTISPAGWLVCLCDKHKEQQ